MSYPNLVALMRTLTGVCIGAGLGCALVGTDACVVLVWLGLAGWMGWAGQWLEAA